ncbi:MAG: hypothetical protein IJ442_02265 [Bacteroidaceae bacterium]|nr:hypothetical protein [Bacteroidaceae bacterium]
MKKHFLPYIICCIVSLCVAVCAQALPRYAVVAAEHTGLESNPNYVDLRPNDTDAHMYLWEGTLTGSDGTGEPYEGSTYVHMVINSGWFGFGFITDTPRDFSLFAERDMVLHFAIRTNATCDMRVQLEGPGYPNVAKINLKGAYDVPRDGEWHVVEIPMSAFFSQGLVWDGKVSGKNYFTIISENSTAGQYLDIDYVYFHDGVRENGTAYENPFAAGDISPENPAYYLIASEHTGVEGNPDYVDIRPDDVTKHLYVWENTAEGYEPAGEPYEGGQYSCFHVTAPAGWFGFGVVNDGIAVDFAPIHKQPYFLRFAIKTASLMPLFVKLEGQNGTSAVVYIKGDYEFLRDDQWHLVEIPMSDFLSQGLDWNGTLTNALYFSIVSEKATPDYLLSFDGVWIEAGEPSGASEETPDVDVNSLPDFVMVACEEGVAPANGNVMDMRPNGSSINLYVWENTAVEAPADGEAWEGSQYSALKVQNTWFGFGIQNSAPFDFTCFAYKEFYLHLAIKTTSTMPLFIKLEGLYEASINLAGEYAFERDGEWHELNIPMRDFFSQGLVWNGMMEGKNFFALISEQAENGAVVAFDGIYFYSTGNAINSVERVEVNDGAILYMGGIIYPADTAQPTVVCNVAGQQIYNGVADAIDTRAWAAGIYVVRNGESVRKIIIK